DYYCCSYVTNTILLF
nr:immunoglobulin light chain junction region [Macaca mulatta]MOX28642.1 immunoglobulin light chain junction region [Macaca mulatta]MOX29022.1 immunoglobulin light chain junction region [Macaca mulatta]MOX32912.1 immunoglobulin light chain junction region [Macaca mulatta]